MTKYYLVPKEEIDRVEEARLNLWNNIGNLSQELKSQIVTGVTGKLYITAQRKYQSIEL